MNELILEEASDWFVELNDGEAGRTRREQFDSWLRRSPEHVRAYVEISAAWEESSRLGRNAVETQALVARALEETNVVTLKSGEPSVRVRSSTVGWSVAAGIAAVAATVLLAWPFNRGAYVTQVGEQRSVVLEDGSTVELNTRSKIRVQFSRRERRIELLEGQALFQVAQERNRPFVVWSGDSRVRAVGTAFDVYRKIAGTRVTVVEGRVAVSQNSASAPLELGEGEQVLVTPTAISPAAHANVASATAWTQRQLVFDNVPLAEAVEEFNRFNARRIVIEDPRLDGFHIRGTFPATDHQRLVDFLRERFGVRVIEGRRELRLLPK